MYTDCVEEFKGCPILLITDLGTENGFAASIQCYFRDDINAHRYVPSPRNQRIESWWSYLFKTRCGWWRNFFKDMESQGFLNMTLETQRECLWYCFYEILQEDLTFVKEHWNSHRIRKSRFDTIAVRPDVLYEIPERYDGEKDLILSICTGEFQDIKINIVQKSEGSEYKAYFKYLQDELMIPTPRNWTDAFEMYKKLIVHA